MGKSDDDEICVSFKFEVAPVKFDLTAKHEGPDFSKPSRAVLANADGTGVVLWAVGVHIEEEISNAGRQLSDLGLDDAPDGISVWEGVWNGFERHTPDGSEYDSEARGAFREPTEAEWESIRKGECPWEKIEWLKALR